MGDVYQGKIVVANNVNTDYRALAGPVKITLWHKWSNATEGILNDVVLEASGLSELCTFNTESGENDIWEFIVQILGGPETGKLYVGEFEANLHAEDHDSVVLVNLNPGEQNNFLEAEFLFMDDRNRKGLLERLPV